MKLLKLCGGVLVIMLGATLVAFAQDGNRPAASPEVRNASKLARPVDVVAADEGESLHINAALTEDGRWRIAGVVGLGKDLLGHRVITVKKDGDPRIDMVLTLRVPVFELEDGTRVAGGVDSVRINKDTVTLTIRDSGDGVGAIAGDPIFTGGCEGGVDGHGDFHCTNFSCPGICTRFQVGGFTLCKCVQAE